MLVNRLFLILVLVISLSACDKQFTTVGDSDVFTENVFNLSPKAQVLRIKASDVNWIMRVKEVEESMNLQMDTIKGKWYTLTKESGGEYLCVSVSSNLEKARTLYIGIVCDNRFSQIEVSQEGFSGFE